MPFLFLSKIAKHEHELKQLAEAKLAADDLWAPDEKSTVSTRQLSLLACGIEQWLQIRTFSIHFGALNSKKENAKCTSKVYSVDQRMVRVTP